MTFPAQDLWQTPPEPIAAMLKAPQLPDMGFSPNNEWVIEFTPTELPPIADLTEPVVAIAGIQINPQTWGPAKAGYYRALAVRRREETTARPVVLPENARIRDLSWSDCGRYLAFTHTDLIPSESSASESSGLESSGSSDSEATAKSGISLWILDVETAKARPLTGPILHAIGSNPVCWLPNNNLLCKIRIDKGEPPKESRVPIGPIIEENLGRTAPSRTYTSLLKTPHDEALLEYYLSAQIIQVSFTGEQTPITGAGLFKGMTPSPDGNWIKVITTHRPFSYQVPLSRFPKRTEVINLQGESVYTIADLPLAEEIPIDFDSVREGRRAAGWRADKPATLYWIEALDGGDGGAASEQRDRVYTLSAPFTAEPQVLWTSELRYNSIEWGNSEIALAYEALYNTRQIRTWRINPDAPEQPPVLLESRNFQDAYSHPGEAVTAPGPYAWHVLLFSPTGDIYRNGRGASPDGVYPFLDKINLATGEKERLWQAPNGGFSRVRRLLDPAANQLIIAKESKTEPSNYWLYDRTEQTEIPLSHFQDPLPWYKNVQKEIVRYPRKDGLELSGTLYLPPGYEAERDGPLPTLLWVYPEEHKSRETASQVTRAEDTFARPSYDSVLFLLTQGYALLSGPAMPIIGEGDSEPNDTYLEQLIDSAQAAVDYLVARGVSDRTQLAIGGHSYGAFTTANLLAHSDLFAAGIARSGAYNRTLTPFGFQGEQRNYWQAPDTYLKMSPFTHADKITQPLLLIHGAADTNIGTFPIQSDRLYEAIKGLGGTVRYVSLPYEEHGYRSREAISHVLWEMVRWLDTYLKPDQ
jgi:dipeptidyl aminopeptidase/acylaminoacyl peptidase